MSTKQVLLLKTHGRGDYAYLIGEGDIAALKRDCATLNNAIAALQEFNAGAPYDDDVEWERRYAASNIDTETLGDEISLEDIAWFGIFCSDEIKATR